MAATKREFSPEAKGYKATLKALNKTESPIHREGAKEMREKRLKSEAPESAEARAGKERLAEFVEREDLAVESIDRLSIYLECEPWEALKRLEGRGSTFDKFIETHRNQHVETGDDRSNFVLLDSHVGGDLSLALREADSLDLLDWQWDSALRAKNAKDPEYKIEANIDLELPRIKMISYGVTPDGKNIDVDWENKDVISVWSLAKDHTKDKAWYSAGWDGSNLKIHPVLLRRDFWTIGREIAMAFPEQFGYKDAKEADLMITAQVEKIGRAFKQDMKKIDGAFYVGPKTEKQEQLRELDKKVAQEIVLKYKQVLENRRLAELAAKNEIRRADRAYKAERHELLARLDYINKELGLGVNLPMVREATGPVAWFKKQMEGLAQVVNAKAAEKKQLADDARKALWIERRQVAAKLTTQNNQALLDNRNLALSDAPKSSSQHSGYNSRAEVLGTDVDYWELIDI